MPSVYSMIVERDCKMDAAITSKKPSEELLSLIIVPDKVNPKFLSKHSIGTLICLLGVLILTPDAILLRKLSHLPNYTVVFFRFVLLTSTCTSILLAYDRTNIYRRLQSISKLGALAALIWGISKFLITIALQTASVGSVLVILAANPMFSALFSYLILGEVIKMHTFMASIVCFVAILVIFVSELEGAGAGGGEE
ncbi:EamA family transporter, partial [archaeon]